MSIKTVVENTDTRAGRVFALTVQALIVLSLVAFCVETLPGVSVSTLAFLQALEVVTVAVFTVEYLLRVAVADRRLGYVFSFFGLIDLLAILPFYVTSGVDLRSVRVFRLFRLLRIFKIVRYTSALRRFRLAFAEVREELALFLVATAIVMFVASVGIYYCEHDAQPEAFASVFHCMWWAVATFTTVGYGDVFPITAGGKVFTFVMLVIGLGVVAVPSALFASALTKVRTAEA